MESFFTIIVLFNLGAFYSFTWLIQRVSAVLVSTIDYIVPIIGVTGGVLLLGEALGGLEVAGAVILIAGAWLTSRTDRQSNSSS